ncbi:MAG: hypothetical protein AB1505_31675 [Candidatus Latescibacterota bacterium]
MVYVEAVAQDPTQVVLRLSGRLLGRSAAELVHGEITRHLQRVRRVHLDLRGVHLIDRHALVCLQALARPRAGSGCPPRVHLWLCGGSRFLQQLLQSRRIPVH